MVRWCGKELTREVVESRYMGVLRQKGQWPHTMPVRLLDDARTNMPTIIVKRDRDTDQETECDVDEIERDSRVCVKVVYSRIACISKKFYPFVDARSVVLQPKAMKRKFNFVLDKPLALASPWSSEQTENDDDKPFAVVACGEPEHIELEAVTTGAGVESSVF